MLKNLIYYPYFLILTNIINIYINVQTERRGNKLLLYYELYNTTLCYLKHFLQKIFTVIVLPTLNFDELYITLLTVYTSQSYDVS